MAPTPVELFLRDLDRQWPTVGEKIPLKVLGSTALMLQTPYVRGTKDSDVLGMDPVLGEVATKLIELAGVGCGTERIQMPKGSWPGFPGSPLLSPARWSERPLMKS